MPGNIELVRENEPYYRYDGSGNVVDETLHDGTILTARYGEGEDDKLTLDLPTANKLAVNVAAAGLTLAAYARRTGLSLQR